MNAKQNKDLKRFYRPEVRVIENAAGNSGPIIAQVRTGTAVTVVALSNDAAISQLRSVLQMAWSLGFTDGRANPDYDQYGDPMST